MFAFLITQQQPLPCGAIAEGLEERKAEKADDKAAAEQKDQPKKKAARKEEAAAE